MKGITRKVLKRKKHAGILTATNGNARTSFTSNMRVNG